MIAITAERELLITESRTSDYFIDITDILDANRAVRRGIRAS